MISIHETNMSGADFEVTKLLLVEDNQEDIIVFNESLYASDYSVDYFAVRVVKTLKEADEILSQHKFHLIILDIYLPDSDDLSGIERIVSKYPETPIIVMTGYYNKELVYKLRDVGVVEVLEKGLFKKNELARSFINAIKRHEIELEISRCKREIQ